MTLAKDANQLDVVGLIEVGDQERKAADGPSAKRRKIDRLTQTSRSAARLELEKPKVLAERFHEVVGHRCASDSPIVANLMEAICDGCRPEENQLQGSLPAATSERRCQSSSVSATGGPDVMPSSIRERSLDLLCSS